MNHDRCRVDDPTYAALDRRPSTSGTHIGPMDGEPADLRVRGPAIVLLGYLAGAISPESLSSHPDVIIEGEAERVAELPDLFDVAADDCVLHPAPENLPQQGAPA